MINSALVEKSEKATGWREMAGAALCWGLFLAALLYYTQAYVAFGRWFWLDEAITSMIATDPSPTHAFASITNGIDSNLPGLYVMLRALKVVGYPMSDTALHALSFVALWFLLVGLYAMLRLAFSRSITILSILPLLMADTVVRHAFEIRFYMFWAAVSVWLAYALARLQRVRGRMTGWHWLVLALTAMAASIHYFSLITLASIVVCDWLADGRDRREKWLSRWPVLPGMLPALVAPWLYIHQRRELSGTWMSPTTLQDTGVFLSKALMLDKVAIGAGICAAVWIAGRRVRLLKPQAGELGDVKLLAGLAGLLALPLILVVMAWTLQPVLVVRYALPGLPAVTLLFAWMLYRLPRVILVAIFIVVLSGVTHSFQQVPDEVVHSMEVMSGMGFDLATKAPPGPVLFEGRHDLYPVLLYLPGLQSRLFYLDYEVNEESAETLPISPNFSLFERDAQRAVVRQYPYVQSWPKSHLHDWESFTLVHFGGAMFPVNLARIQARFPGWDIYAINDHLLWFRKRPIVASTVELPSTPGH